MSEPDYHLLRLLGFLSELRKVSISCTLSQARPEAIMVSATVPGERWEVEFMLNGSVEVEVFRSDGTILDGGALKELLAYGERPGSAND